MSWNGSVDHPSAPLALTSRLTTLDFYYSLCRNHRLVLRLGWLVIGKEFGEAINDLISSNE